MTQYRMFSEPALRAFRHFLAVDARTRNPAGAYDAMPRQIKRMGRDNAGYDPETAGHNQEGIIDLMRFVQGKISDEGGDIAQFMKKLDAAFPGCLGDLDFSGIDDGAQDDADFDWPPSNAGGPLGEDDEGGPVPFKGMPKRGGGRLNGAEDASLSYRKMFPQTAGIGMDPTPTAANHHARESKMMAMDSAMSSDDLRSYDRMFPDAAKIKIL